MMIYAPRAIRHFSLAAAEARAPRAAEASQNVPRSKPVAPTLPAKPLSVPKGRVVVRLWLPLTLIALILAPFALLLAPLLYFAPRPYCDRPFATVLGVGDLLLHLGGTVVEVDTPEALVRIRIF